MSRWVVVLAGGSGTRFWPLSTPTTPKQFLPLAGDTSLLEQSVRRLTGVVPAKRILIVTGRALAEATRRAIPTVPADNVLAEPRAASTGPALTWATAVVAERDPSGTVLSVHADWSIPDADGFRHHADLALNAAEQHDRLITVGIVPTRPDIGFGYIEVGERLDDQVQGVTRFREKPTEEEARRLIAGGALWNSGMFAWTVSRFVAETEAVATEIAALLPTLRAGDVETFFRDVTPVPIDVSHFERSSRVGVVAGQFAWDDLGTWTALRRARDRDAAGNVLVGDAVQHASSGCVAWADDGPIVLFGVEDLVVVRANGIVLVTTTQRAAHLKDLLDTLPDRLRAP